MKTFVYKARTLSGAVVSGQVVANEINEVKAKLRNQHLIPIKVVVKSKGFQFSGLGVDSVPQKALVASTRQFATMINSGITVSQSLSILKNSTDNKPLAKVYDKMEQKIMSGEKLAESMQPFPKVFDNVFTSMVEAGEKGGILHDVLNRMSDYTEKSHKLKSKIKAAMWYPLGVITVGTGIIGFILVYVIPKFTEFFKSADQELPLITQIVVDVSDFVRNYWYGIPIAIIIAFVTIVRLAKSKTFVEAYHTFILKVPLFGSLIQKADMAKVCRTISTLLQAGVDITSTLDMASKVCSNTNIARSISEARLSVINGNAISKPLEKNPFIPLMVTKMIAVGEQSGTIDQLLFKLSDYYEHEVEQTAETLTTFIEPALIVILGGMVAFIIIAMYMPIFKLAGAGA